MWLTPFAKPDAQNERLLYTNYHIPVGSIRNKILRSETPTGVYSTDPRRLASFGRSVYGPAVSRYAVVCDLAQFVDSACSATRSSKGAGTGSKRSQLAVGSNGAEQCHWRFDKSPAAQRAVGISWAFTVGLGGGPVGF